MANTRQDMRDKLDRKGLHWARSILSVLSPDDDNFLYVTEWISEKEFELKADLEARQLNLAKRSTEAAETSATASLEAARASGTSARAAVFAAIVSFFALVVAVAAYLKQS